MGKGKREKRLIKDLFCELQIFFKCNVQSLGSTFPAILFTAAEDTAAPVHTPARKEWLPGVCLQHFVPTSLKCPMRRCFQHFLWQSRQLQEALCSRKIYLVAGLRSRSLRLQSLCFTASETISCTKTDVPSRFIEIQNCVGSGLAMFPQGHRAQNPARAGDLARQWLLLQSPRWTLFLQASQTQDKIFFSKFDTEQETKQQMMAPLHTLSKAGGMLQSSLWLQENRTATVWFGPCRALCGFRRRGLQ